MRKKREELKGLDEKVSNLKNSTRVCDERYIGVNKQISDVQAIEKIVKDKERELERMRLSRQHAVEKIEGVIRDLKAKVQRLTEYRCDATGASSCPFLSDAREAKKAIPVCEAELRRLTGVKDLQQEKLFQELEGLRQKCQSMSSLRKESERLLSMKSGLEGELRRADERIRVLKDETQPLAEAEQAAKELPELAAELAALEKEKGKYITEADRAIATIEARIKALEGEVTRVVIDPTLSEGREKCVQTLSALSVRMDGQRTEEAALRKEAGALDELSAGSRSRRRNAQSLTRKSIIS